MKTLKRLLSESGTTLLEIMIAVAILGISFVALLGGMTTSIIASDFHRKEATAGAALRNFAEAVKAEAYDGTCPATYSPAFTPPNDPSGAPYVATIASTEYWEAGTGTAPTTATFTPTCVADAGLQRLTVQVASPDGRAIETLTILKRR